MSPFNAHHPLRAAALVLALGAGLVGCGGEPHDVFANSRPFLAEGPYAEVLVACVRVEEPEESCLLDDLPLLGMDTMSPDIDDVMERVVVSHDWMGVRFRQALEQLDPHLLQMLRSVTAIVIDDDIRPSRYLPISGAIYLDPFFLWTTNAEKDTIWKGQDYRAGFGDRLSFFVFARFVRDDDWAFGDFSLFDDIERTIDDLEEPLAALLYHELAHAVDFVPAGEIGGLDSSRSFFEAVLETDYPWPSFELDDDDPLTSSLLFGIAAVRFRGVDPTFAQRAVTASQAAAAFEPDGANDDYAYSNVREDLAMLFEETMMRYAYGIERDVAFIPSPSNPTGCESYVVTWGTRNRIGRANVKERARFVTDRILPDLDLDAFYASLDPPEDLRTGIDWCDSVVLEAPPTARASEATRAQRVHFGPSPYAYE